MNYLSAPPIDWSICVTTTGQHISCVVGQDVQAWLTVLSDRLVVAAVVALLAGGALLRRLGRRVHDPVRP